MGNGGGNYVRHEWFWCQLLCDRVTEGVIGVIWVMKEEIK